jgi:DNA polymerase-3 subunit chi
MLEVSFYQAKLLSLEQVLPKLLEKILASGNRAVVKCGSRERVDFLDSVLWTQDKDSFLPHGTAKDGCHELQPIWLTVLDENPNSARIILLVDGAETESFETFERCLEIIDGNNSESISAARARWKIYSSRGYKLNYWEQGANGKWEPLVSDSLRVVSGQI